MNMTTQREAFELWAQPRGYMLEKIDDNQASYEFSDTYYAWEGYKAALSQPNEPLGEIGFNGDFIFYLENDAGVTQEFPATGTKLYAEALISSDVGLNVNVSSMQESNGNKWWSVWLSKNAEDKAWDGYQVYTDKIEGRAQYEAACLRHFLGQCEKPDLLAFDTDDNTTPPKREWVNLSAKETTNIYQKWVVGTYTDFVKAIEDKLKELNTSQVIGIDCSNVYVDEQVNKALEKAVNICYEITANRKYQSIICYDMASELMRRIRKLIK